MQVAGRLLELQLGTLALCDLPKVGHLSALKVRL